MAELSVHSSGDEAASGSQAAEDSSDAEKEASHGQDSERQSSGERSEGAEPEDDAPARCCCTFVPPSSVVSSMRSHLKHQHRLRSTHTVMRTQGKREAHHEGQHEEWCE